MALQEFSCEICGERHFKEWKHQNGMRALGIPNNKNFYEVTQIAEAKALWANIQVGGDAARCTLRGGGASMLSCICRSRLHTSILLSSSCPVAGSGEGRLQCPHRGGV